MKEIQKQFRYLGGEVVLQDILDIPLKPAERQLSRIETNIAEEAGLDVLKMISAFTNVNHHSTLVFSTASFFNINKIDKRSTESLVNLKRINDIRRINKFFEIINENTSNNTLFIGCAETLELRNQRLLNKFPRILNRLYIFGDYIFKRVFPKLPFTKQLYFTLTGGRNRVISRAETLGRLYSCGFEVIHEEVHGYLYYFVARKVNTPVYDKNPSYGPVFGMKRSGKKGKNIKVYKFRTMYPFSEYLQQYIYDKNQLDVCGKFKDDFRVTGFGKFLRKFWLDELPMLFNLLKGDLKLVGVRPLSKQYQSLYPEDLLAMRHKFRPGLVPPFYADMPKNFDEIVESERRYLQKYEKCGWCADVDYFFRAFINIVFRNARSK